MLSLRRVAALIPTVAVLMAPSAAHAGRAVADDPAADAQSISADADVEVFTPAPEHMAADITRTVVTHGARRVSVQVRFRDLEPSSTYGAFVKVRTPHRRFDVETFRGPDGTRTALTRGQRDDAVACPGLRSSVDGAREQLTVSVPTACLGGPAWVRVGVVSLAADVDVSGLYYFDDAHLTGGYEDRDARLGAKVFRG